MNSSYGEDLQSLSPTATTNGGGGGGSSSGVGSLNSASTSGSGGKSVPYVNRFLPSKKLDSING